MNNILGYLERQNKAFIIRMALWLIILMGLIDYLTGPEVAFSIFYLLPIALITWTNGIFWGVVMAFISSTIWFLADTLSGHQYSHPALGYWAANMRLGYFLIITYLTGTVKRLFNEQRDYAVTDYLTGIANTRGFYQAAESELKQARRHNHPLTAAYIDLDNFKKINDLFGHSTGDSVLQLIAKTIKQHIRPGDIVGRLGGDEFALILPRTGSDSAKTVLDRLRDTLLESMKSYRWGITFSIGVVTFVTPPNELDDLIIKADHLMYAVKNSGKNMIKYEVITKDTTT